MRATFLNLVADYEHHGAALFEQLIPEDRFVDLASHYEAKMEAHANHSELGHSFLNFRDHTDLLTDPRFSDAFFNPLVIAVLSFYLNELLFLFDVRGKDTGAVLTMERDNGPHFDDTVFHPEVKILMAWKKRSEDEIQHKKIKGPSGQNFVFCTKGDDPLLRPVQQAHEHDANLRGLPFSRMIDNPGAKLIEAEHERPVTVAFVASDVMHHRARSDEKSGSSHDPRSVVILAFHGVSRNADYAYSTEIAESQPELFHLMLGDRRSKIPEQNRNSAFVDALEAFGGDRIKSTLLRVAQREVNIDLKNKEMTPVRKQQYLETLARIERMGERKPKLEPSFSVEELLVIMDLEKNINLDMKLYPDGRELWRKDLRNTIRERGIQSVQQRPNVMAKLSQIKMTPEQCLSTRDIIQDLQRVQFDIAWLSVALKKVDARVLQLPQVHDLAYKLKEYSQLTHDLIEGISRCDSPELFRAYSLFSFWLVEDLKQLFVDKNLVFNSSSSSSSIPSSAWLSPEVCAMPQRVLNHYASTVCCDQGLDLRRVSLNTACETPVLHARL